MTSRSFYPLFSGFCFFLRQVDSRCLLWRSLFSMQVIDITKDKANKMLIIGLTRNSACVSKRHILRSQREEGYKGGAHKISDAPRSLKEGASSQDIAMYKATTIPLCGTPRKISGGCIMTGQTFVTAQCRICQKSFLTKLHKARYCSQDCWDRARAAHQEEQRQAQDKAQWEKAQQVTWKTVEKVLPGVFGEVER